MDIGGRYTINQNWGVDFGYRVLALSGVAITEDNVAQGNFQNELGISDTQTTGSYILHGGYAGLTYCW
jgi:long-subunit fatty acid transport protein